MILQSILVLWSALATPESGDSLAVRQSKDSSIRPASRRDSIPARLPITVITGTVGGKKRNETSSTINSLSAKEVETTRPAHPAGLLNRLPGVHVSQLSAEGHGMAIRQPISTRPMYLYLEDGIPTRATGFFNHNALYEVNIPQSGGIEVLKGPGNALFGSDAIGGVVNVFTKAPPAKPTVEATLEGGSFGWRRALISAGTRRGTNAIRGDLNLTRSAGSRDNSPYKRVSATIRGDLVAPFSWMSKSLVTATRVSQFDVPTISDSLYKASSRFNSAPIAFRDVEAVRISNSLEKSQTSTVWSITPYTRYNSMSLIPSWQLSYDPQIWDQSNYSVGLSSKVRRTLDRIHTTITSGLELDYSPGKFRADQILLDTTYASTTIPMHFASYRPGANHYDYAVTYQAASPFVQAEMLLFQRIRVDAGVRMDYSTYRYSTHLSPLDTGSHRIPESMNISFRRMSPKLGLSADIGGGHNFYGSVRHGFRAPSQGQLFQQNSADNTTSLKPVTSSSYEIGFRGVIGPWADYSISAYDMMIRNDIVSYRTPLNTTEATNAGRTSHRGLELAIGFTPADDLAISLSSTVTRQKYITWDPSSTVSYGGNLIEMAPASLHNIVISYSPVQLRGGRLSAEVSSMGDYYMDPANTRKYGGHSLVHLHGNYPVNGYVEAFTRISNLGNRRHAETATFNAFQGAQFGPGTGRNFTLGARIRMTRD